MSIDIPKDVYDRAAEIANSERVSVADVFVTAFAEHIAAWERLQARAALGDREKFLGVLAKVPDTEPAEHDRFSDV